MYLDGNFHFFANLITFDQFPQPFQMVSTLVEVDLCLNMLFNICYYDSCLDHPQFYVKFLLNELDDEVPILKLFHGYVIIKHYFCDIIT